MHCFIQGGLNKFDKQTDKHKNFIINPFNHEEISILLLLSFPSPLHQRALILQLAGANSRILPTSYSALFGTRGGFITNEFSKKNSPLVANSIFIDMCYLLPRFFKMS